MNYSLAPERTNISQNQLIHLIKNNLSLEGAMNMILGPFCLSWAILSEYKL